MEVQHRPTAHRAPPFGPPQHQRPRRTRGRFQVALLVLTLFWMLTGNAVQARCQGTAGNHRRAAIPESRFFDVEISPDLNAAEAHAAQRVVLDIFLNKLCRPGDRLIVGNPTTGTRISDVTLDHRITSCDRKFRSWRVKAHAPQIAQINRYLEGMKNGEPHDRIATLDLPASTASVATRLSEAPAAQYYREVIFFGDPVYRSATVSLAKAWPSDGHIRAVPELSVFSAQGREQEFAQTRVHIVFPSADIHLNSLHFAKSREFWGAWFGALGGDLVTYSADSHLTSRLAAPDLPSYRRNLREVDQAVVLYSAEQLPVNLFAENIKKAPPPTAERGTLVVGIKWACQSCDLDIYGSIQEAEEEVSFRRPFAAFAQHLKDYQVGANGQLERIDFSRPVRPEDVTIRVNLYSGRSPVFPARGEVRVLFNSAVYAAPFAIQSQKGNFGAEGADQKQYWTEISLPAVLGIPGQDPKNQRAAGSKSRPLTASVPR